MRPKLQRVERMRSQSLCMRRHHRRRVHSTSLLRLFPLDPRLGQANLLQRLRSHNRTSRCRRPLLLPGHYFQSTRPAAATTTTTVVSVLLLLTCLRTPLRSNSRLVRHHQWHTLSCSWRSSVTDRNARRGVLMAQCARLVARWGAPPSLRRDRRWLRNPTIRASCHIRQTLMRAPETASTPISPCSRPN